MHAKISITVLIVALLGVVYVGIFQRELIRTIFTTQSQTVVAPVSEVDAYADPAQGISFTYAKSYKLEERDLTVNNAPVHIITLTRKDEVVPANGEGGTAMNVSIFTVEKQELLADWLRSMGSGSPVPTTGYDYGEETIGGEPALIYSATGLYESDNVAIMKGNRVYIFSASWLTREDVLLKDFGKLLESLSFTK